MNNNDYVSWFAIISLFNTNLGLSNFSKNNEQEEKQQRIEKKLDKLIKLVEELNELCK